MEDEAGVNSYIVGRTVPHSYFKRLRYKLLLAIGWTLRVFACSTSWAPWPFLILSHEHPHFIDEFIRINLSAWGVYLLWVTGWTLTIIITYRFGGAVYFLAKRHLALSAKEIMARDARPHVLYLRSFQDDATAVPHSFVPTSVGVNLLTEEERLAWVFRKIGPLIALGAPAEQSSPPGAGRMYAPNSLWQDAITELVMKARLVVLRIDDKSEALIWEFLQAIACLDPKQLLLLISYHPEEYKLFRQRVHACCQLRYPLPMWPNLPLLDYRKTVCGAIFFQPKWRPTVIKFGYSNRGPRGVERKIMKDLHPFLKQHSSSV